MVCCRIVGSLACCFRQLFDRISGEKCTAKLTSGRSTAEVAVVVVVDGLRRENSYYYYYYDCDN